MDELEVVEWSLDGVLEDMKVINDSMKDRQFAFILGAGASVSSGIPTGQYLAEKWLKDLYLRECLDGRPIEQWVNECGVGGFDGVLTLDNAAQFYPQIFERRFEGDREAGYAELEVAMEGKSPSLGYSLLAEIIQHTRHKVVVTTNFDNLVADALAMHAHQSPLIVAHESLAGFVRPQMRRPLVAKIHRDLYLNPINDAAGVSTMELGWKIALKKLFQYFTPVVIGYGGNDGSLMDMLMGLELGDIAGRTIWCYRENSRPPEKALKMLAKHKGILVKVPSFDQFMLRLAAKLVDKFDVAAIAERTAELGQERANRYREQASELRTNSLNGTPIEKKTGEILTASVQSGDSWFSWVLMAQDEPDLAKRDLIFQKGIKLFPKSADLVSNYGTFLGVQLKYSEAETAFKTAIELDPNNSQLLAKYANFLETNAQDFDRSELIYQSAVAVENPHGNTLAMYAMFLARHRNDYQAADLQFRRALECSPKNYWALTRYGQFLEEFPKDFKLADSMYSQALKLNPDSSWLLVTYANFQLNRNNDRAAASLKFNKAIEIDPDDEWVNNNYTRFLASSNTWPLPEK